MFELALALIPAVVLLAAIYTADTADREPWGLVLKCVGLGALAIIPIAIIEGIADEVFSLTFGADTLSYLFISTLIGVALVEEAFKMAAALIPAWKSDQFDYVFDGIVYCVAAAVGYAAIENVMYVCLADPSEMLDTAVVRALMSVPSHVFDGILMGVFVGYAKLWKFRGNDGKKTAFLVLALVAPMIEHCLYDFFASIEGDAASLFVIGMVFVEYVLAFVIVFKLRGKHDIAIPLPARTGAPSAQEGLDGAAQGFAANRPLGGEQSEAPSFAGTSPQVVSPYATPERTAAGKRFCPECGAPQSPGNRFCPECGTPQAR